MEKRDARIAVSETAALKVGEDWLPCALVNISDNGFLIKCSKKFAVGEVLEFRCELFPGKTLNCKVEIRHIGAAGIGTKIVEISDRGVRLRALYLEEQYSHKVGRQG